MRKAIYKEYDFDGSFVEKPCWLHGIDKTVAIIEKEDGNMMEMATSFIRLIDHPEADQLAEFAKAAMQGLLSNRAIMNIHAEGSSTWVSEHAIMQAKSLIAELNKHEPIESTGYSTPYLRIEQEQAYERMKALGINIHAQTFEQCVNDLLYRLENNNSHEQA